uniref:Vasculin n=2 Tax=Myotis myotis TaxID=51298 RepID=A0A7J7XZ30_MYOMY|nr:GC-rich promoter binding protein 1 [Myotis myotis]
MAQHDFAPAWLNFPTPPSSTKSSLNFEKHSEHFSWTENRYDVSRRRHNSSDGFDSGIGRPSGGNFGRKEKNGWRAHGRNGTENINHRGGYHGGSARSRSSIFHSGKGQGLHDNNTPDSEPGRKEDRRERKQFEAEDFPSLNPEYEREPNQNKSLAAGVWVFLPLSPGLHAQTHTYPTKTISQAPLLEYPPNPTSRAPRMLVIKKGTAKDLQLSGFPAGGAPPSQPVKNGTGPSVYKGLVPKPAAPPTKPTQWKSQTKENKVGTSFSHESTYGVGNFNAFKSTAKNFSPSTTTVKECNRSNSSSPVDKLNQQPRLTKLTRMRTDKKSEFLKALKRDRVEEEHEDESHAGSEKDEDSFNLHNSNSTHQDRDINRNFDENEIPQENGNASVISPQIIRSSTFPQTDVLSSSLEAEHRLLKEMGWQEDSENDETCAPLTEDEMREFQVISEQLQKNGLRKNGILKNGLICDFKFGPWKSSTFHPTVENDDSETSSSDTSDDDDV